MKTSDFGNAPVVTVADATRLRVHGYAKDGESSLFQVMFDAPVVTADKLQDARTLWIEVLDDNDEFAGLLRVDLTIVKHGGTHELCVTLGPMTASLSGAFPIVAYSKYRWNLFVESPTVVLTQFVTFTHRRWSVRLFGSASAKDRADELPRSNGDLLIDVGEEGDLTVEVQLEGMPSDLSVSPPTFDSWLALPTSDRIHRLTAFEVEPTEDEIDSLVRLLDDGAEVRIIDGPSYLRADVGDLLAMEEEFRGRARRAYVSRLIHSVVQSVKDEVGRLAAAKVPLDDREYARCQAAGLMALQSLRMKGSTSIVDSLRRMGSEPWQIELEVEEWPQPPVESKDWDTWVEQWKPLDEEADRVIDIQLNADFQNKVRRKDIGDIDRLVDAALDAAPNDGSSMGRLLALFSLADFALPNVSLQAVRETIAGHALAPLIIQRPDVVVAANYPGAGEIRFGEKVPPPEASIFIRAGLLPFRDTQLATYSAPTPFMERAFAAYDPLSFVSPRIAAVTLQHIEEAALVPLSGIYVFADAGDAQDRRLEWLNAIGGVEENSLIKWLLGSAEPALERVEEESGAQFLMAAECMGAAFKRFDGETHEVEYLRHHRSFTDQAKLNWKADDRDAEEVSLLDVAAPGTSRHHYGSDRDIFANAMDEVLNTELRFGGAGFTMFYWYDIFGWHFGLMRPFSKRPFRSDSIARLDLSIDPDLNDEPATMCTRGYLEERWHWSYWPIGDALVERAGALLAPLHGALTGRGTAGSDDPKWTQGYEISTIHWPEYVFNVERHLRPLHKP